MFVEDFCSWVVVEMMVIMGLVYVVGEVMMFLYVDILWIVCDIVFEIGYDFFIKGFDGNLCGVEVLIGV